MSNKQAESTLEMARETARIQWVELERHFARGVVIKVHASLDLVRVAARFVADDKASVEQLLDERNIEQLTIETAKSWSCSEPELWAVVAAPWVLVQERI
ncbi:MAG: DUF2288 domain-containing protein [Gammaproteobacteria bacterium]